MTDESMANMNELIYQIVHHRAAVLHRRPDADPAALEALLLDLDRYGAAGWLLKRTFADGLISSTPTGAVAAEDVTLILDGDNRVRYFSPSAVRALGSEPVIGTSISALIHGEDLAHIESLRAGSRESARCGHRIWRMRTKAGWWAGFTASCMNLTGDHAVSALVVTLRPAGSLPHDPMTGLLDRPAFVECLRRAPTPSVAVILISLDDHQMINDALGHEGGDALLRAAAARLTEVIGPDAPIARLGGNEFATLIDHAGEPTVAVRRIMNAFEQPFAVDSFSFGVTASVGVAVSNGTHDRGDLLRQAFLALSVARRSGRGRWRRYERPMQTDALQRLQLHAELDRAIGERAFALEYQPIVSLTSFALVGFEALLRWYHSRLGPIPPATFIDTAEATGLIVPIGAWALLNAVRTASRWQAGTNVPLTVAVNVSARQVQESDFADAIHRALDEAGLPPGRLTLELTESLLLPVEDPAWGRLARLRRCGVRIAIDDFGTGYSSLSYLSRLPVDIIKIDRSFVRDLVMSSEQRAVVESIVALARRLELQVVAEGIEQRDEYVALRRMGCDFGQGFLFARPLTSAEAARRARLATSGQTSTR